MPSARDVLLDSASSWTDASENRLTEIFATVLAACPELAHEMFRRLDLPEGDGYAVRTQFEAVSGSRPDMELVAYGAGGAEVARIWFEHKTVSDFRDMQREDYLEVLRRLPGRSELLVIAPGGLKARDPGPGVWNWRSWPEVAEMANSVGEQAAGAQWRRLALSPQFSSEVASSSRIHLVPRKGAWHRHESAHPRQDRHVRSRRRGLSHPCRARGTRGG